MIRILVPLDGSALAEQALGHAFALARTFPAEITVLRVITESESGTPMRISSVDFALLHHQAQTYLDGLLERNAGIGVPIRSEVVEGRSAETIVQFLHREKPDLVVLTRYGRGNAQDFAAGGTAYKIVSSADCSVILVDPRTPMTPEYRYHRLLVPIDSGKDSDYAVAVATMIAEIHGSSVLLLYVTEEPQLPAALSSTRHAHQLANEMRRIIRREAEHRLFELAAKFPKNITVETRMVVSADTPFAIESAAADYDSDLILLHTMGARPEGDYRYSSANQSLILYSHRPLFILQPPAEEGLASNFRSVYLDEQPCETSQESAR